MYKSHENATRYREREIDNNNNDDDGGGEMDTNNILINTAAMCFSENCLEYKNVK